MANPLQWLGLGRLTRRFTDPFVSPWQEGNLTEIVYSDIWGNSEFLPMTRGEAITIPSVTKGRNLLVSTASKFPLHAIRHEIKTGTDTDVTDANPWLYRTSGNISPHSRMAWTVDDAIFYGCSVWDVVRGAPDVDGRRAILEAAWRPPGWWRINEKMQIELTDDNGIYWYVPDEQDIIFFDFPFEGLLNIAQRTMKGARDQEIAWVGRAMNPVPLIELRVTDDSNLTPDEVKAFVKAWGENRTSKYGAIGYTPQGIEIHTHGDVKADLMTEGRNAVRTDIGSFLNIPTVMMDGSLSEASLTYTTTEGNRNRFYDESMPFWLDPIAARLSQDDVVPRGTRVRFDLTEGLSGPSPLGEPVAD